MWQGAGDGGGGAGQEVAGVAMRVALEAWCYGAGGARKRDAIWAVVVQEMSCRQAAREVGVTHSLVARWVRQYKAMARQVLPMAGVGVVGEEAEATGDE